jgi:hemerythrin superfamily protein
MGAKSTIKRAKQTVTKALTPNSEGIEETDILDTLEREHKEVKALLADLQDAEQPAERRKLVQQIKEALLPHTKAEQKVVYEALIATRESQVETHGHEGYLEHECASKTFSKLEAANPSSSEHKAAAKVLKDLVEHHIEEEEDNVWSDLRECFDDEQRVRMNAEFEAAKRRIKLS